MERREVSFIVGAGSDIIKPNSAHNKRTDFPTKKELA